jgi:hypothetical protein
MQGKKQKRNKGKKKTEHKPEALATPIQKEKPQEKV